MPKRSTTDQLREDARRGRTRNTIQVSDPAAAPLGTDEEAAGTPTPGEALQQARDYERAMGRKAQENVDEAQGPPTAVWIYVSMILTLVALVSVVVWLSRP
jgi:hypothetical protein